MVGMEIEEGRRVRGGSRFFFVFKRLTLFQTKKYLFQKEEYFTNKKQSKLKYLKFSF